MSRKTIGRAVIACWLALSLPGCLTIVGKRSQNVGITATPFGARVLVDGTFRGETPLILKLAKKPPHVIRIEKDGYRPVEIRLKKQKLLIPLFLSNLLWAPPIAFLGFNPDAQTPGQEFAKVFFPVLGLAVSVGAMALDGASAKSAVLKPGHISVALEKDDGGREPRVIEWDAADLRDLRWISVMAADREARR